MMRIFSYLSLILKSFTTLKQTSLLFQGILSVVKALQRSNEANFNSCNTAHETAFDTFLKTTKPNRLAHKILTSKKQKNLFEAQRKWATECMLETPDNVDWKAVYRTPAAQKTSHQHFSYQGKPQGQ